MAHEPAHDPARHPAHRLAHGLAQAARWARAYLRGASRLEPHRCGSAHLRGTCNVCGRRARFYYDDLRLARESLVCGSCGTTSRYRSMARGVLRAVAELRGVRASSLAQLPRRHGAARLRVYDTQVPFCYPGNAYPLPELLRQCAWIDLHCSSFRPDLPRGTALGPGVSNQDLEQLTFADASFDLLLTSDVMEHVRLDQNAHREIARVLAPSGIYLFTVPHSRMLEETLQRVIVRDPADPSRDEHALEPEYHGNANDPSGGALAYRVYGRDLDQQLRGCGLDASYEKVDRSEHGIVNTELFYCRRR